MKRPTVSVSNTASYQVYILQCADGTYYTGVAKDIEQRIAAHRAGTASKYTRSRLPVRLVYTKRCKDRGMAQRREYAIKRLTREEKSVLVRKTGT